MNLIEQLSEHFKEGSDLEAIGKIITEATALTPDNVKAYVKENQPVYDSLVSTAVESHKKKELDARTTWETTRSEELLKEAMDKIAKENQKTPLEIKLEEMERKLAEKETAEGRANLKSNLLSIVSKDELPIHDVDVFLGYGETAEQKLREYAAQTMSVIDERIQTGLAEKFGKGGMPGAGDKPAGDKPVSTAEHLAESLTRPANGQKI